MQYKEFFNRFHSFTEEMTKWGIQESEKSTQFIFQIVQNVLKKVNTVSNVSQESLNALKKLENVLTSEYVIHNKALINSVIKELSVLSQENKAFSEVIDPVVTALQFQDRLRQNLENMNKFLKAWIEERSTKTSYTDEDLISFGEKLLTLTTMSSERDCIRKHIKNLSEEKTADIGLF